MLEIETNVVTVDDFTGEEIKQNGWALRRLQDGATIHFQSLSMLNPSVDVIPVIEKAQKWSDA